MKIYFLWFSILLVLLFSLFFLFYRSSYAKTNLGLFLPSIIGNNMIVQQQTDAAIWGWDKPGTTVTVTFRGSKVSTQAELDGKWIARVPSGKAGGPFTLTVEGTSTVNLEKVAVGEVWVAGGQSNMWWKVSGCKDSDREIKTANYPDIRVWDANTAPQQAGWRADKPQRTVKAEWKSTTPETVGEFPGTPYFFARELHETLKVPVGIVHLAVPGQEIETFLTQEFMQAQFPQTLEVWEARKKLYPEALKKYKSDLQEWEVQKARAQAQGLEPPKKPEEPVNPDTAAKPAELFNGMIHPAVPYSLKGFLWWQGESNAERSLQYQVLFPGLIEEWRQLWKRYDAPFIFVELANLVAKQTRPSEDDPWPALRDAQHEALRLPETYMISTIDILGEGEDVSNVHPPNKQLAGHRLYLAAMANVYGDRTRVASGPVYKSVQFQGNKAIVTFDQIGSGLIVKDGSELAGFALAGSDREFFWAKGEIRGNTVILTSKDVNQPIAVRYAWANNPIGNLYNKEGLPAFPFRSDNWNLLLKGQDFNNMDMPELAAHIQRELIPRDETIRLLWDKAYKVLGAGRKNEASQIIETLLKERVKEKILAKALKTLNEKIQH
jgi:sialate O-acetylesterase